MCKWAEEAKITGALYTLLPGAGLGAAQGAVMGGG